MLDRHQTMDILLLHRSGESIRQIAQRTGHSRNTIRRILRHGAPRKFHTPHRPSQVDPFREYLRSRFLEHGLSAVRLTEEIRSMGFNGSVQIVRRFLRSLRTRVPAKLTTRFETPPGEQAQADWAEVGRYLDGQGRTVRIYAFVMVLGFSRALYVEFTRSMRVETLMRVHQNAFDYFGGIPKGILYDNMRQVTGRPGHLNPRFRDFADHYGFQALTHRAYRPRTKGKVERAVNYLKDSFLNARRFSSLEELNAQGRHWMQQVANLRIHATTGQRPWDLLEQERRELAPLQALSPYQIVHSVRRTVDAEAMVRFNNVRYSVPAIYCGSRVQLEAGPNSVRIRIGQLVLAQHPPGRTAGQRVESLEHRRQRNQYSVQNPPSPPEKGPILDFSDQLQVQERSLHVYQEVAR